MSRGITRREHAVIQLAISLVDDSDPRLHASRLVASRPATGLSPLALEALKRVLTRGIARRIVLGGGVPTERTPLRFGSATLDLLTWLDSAPLLAARRPTLRLRTPPTVAEQLLFARVVEVLQLIGVTPPDVVATQPWIWLLCGRLLAPRHQVPAFEALAPREHWLLEALGPDLRHRWGAWCRTTRASAPDTTIAHGVAQSALATRFVAPLADQPELAGFLFDLAPQLGTLPLGSWEVVRDSATVGVWQRARRARVAIPRSIIELLGAWGATWRSIGFIDDGYPDAKRALARYDNALVALPRLSRAVEQADHLPEVE